MTLFYEFRTQTFLPHGLLPKCFALSLNLTSQQSCSHFWQGFPPVALPTIPKTQDISLQIKQLWNHQNYVTQTTRLLHFKVIYSLYQSSKSQETNPLISIYLSLSLSSISLEKCLLALQWIVERWCFYHPIALIWDYAWILQLKLAWLRLPLPPPYWVEEEDELIRVCNRFIIAIASIFYFGRLPTANSRMNDAKTWKLPYSARLWSKKWFYTTSLWPLSLWGCFNTCCHLF